MNNPSRKRERLLKKHIIHKAQDFSHIIQDGKVVHGHYFKCFVLPCEESKIGFAVSKRFGKAVQRNFIKRRMREVYRKNNRCFGHWQMIMMPKFSTAKASFQELEKDFNQIIERIGEFFDTE